MNPFPNYRNVESMRVYIRHLEDRMIHLAPQWTGTGIKSIGSLLEQEKRSIGMYCAYQ